MGTHFLLLVFVWAVSSDRHVFYSFIAICSRYITQLKARPIQLQSYPAHPLGMASPSFLYYVKHHVLRVNTNGVNVRFLHCLCTHTYEHMYVCMCVCAHAIVGCHLEWLPVILFCFLYSNRVWNKQISIHILRWEGLNSWKMIQQDIYEDFSIFKFVDWEIFENFP